MGKLRDNVEDIRSQEHANVGVEILRIVLAFIIHLKWILVLTGLAIFAAKSGVVPSEILEWATNFAANIVGTS